MRDSKSKFYQASQAAHPFLQSCAGEAGIAPNDPSADADEGFFTFVECWCQEDKAQAWVEFLNTNAEDFKAEWE